MAINPSFVIGGRSLVRDVFIETGFYEGATVRAAVAAGFAQVYSVEIHPGLYLRGVEAVAAEYPPGKVRLLHRTSPDALPDVIDPNRPTTFYLDGHYSGHAGTWRDEKYGECPLVLELAVIRSARWAVPPVIVIDDVHMFARPWSADLRARFDERQWPQTQDVLATLPDYDIEEHDTTWYAWPKKG